MQSENDGVSLALQRLLAWPEIARSPQLARFLSYIVEHKLNGKEQSIKAYSIAVDVFGRPPQFDPQADPIVRVQARRLRSLLKRYYQGDGQYEPLRIVLPVGRYVPEFVAVETHRPPPAPARAEATPTPPPTGAQTRKKTRRRRPGAHVTLHWLVLAVLLIGSAVLVYALMTWETRRDGAAGGAADFARPRLMVMEFQSLSGSSSDTVFTSGLAVEITTDLSQFETLDVRYGGASGLTPPRASEVDFVLSGIVRRVSSHMQYSAILTEVATNTVVWNGAIALSLDPPDPARPDTADYVALQLSRTLGSSRGPLHQKAREYLAADPDPAGLRSAYLCRILFDLYRDEASHEAAQRGLDCYEGLSERERQQGSAQAAIAILGAETAVVHSNEAPAEDVLLLADARIDGALEVSPLSSFVWEQRARLNELLQRHDAAESAYGSALQLNPASSDALAARARHLALMGELSRAQPLSDAAVKAAPNAPDWYFGVPALIALRDANYAIALEQAGRYANADRELGPILAIIAGQRLGDQESVALYLPRVLELPGFRRAGILSQLRKRIVDERLVREIRMALMAAGVSSAALREAF